MLRQCTDILTVFKMMYYVLLQPYINIHESNPIKPTSYERHKKSDILHKNLMPQPQASVPAS
jgi:hypothetical protein